MGLLLFTPSAAPVLLIIVVMALVSSYSYYISIWNQTPKVRFVMTAICLCNIKELQSSNKN